MTVAIKRVSAELFQRFNWLYLRPFMRFFCHLEIRGQKNVKNLSGNFIVASNHTSEIDPILISSCLPFFSAHKLPLFFITKGKGMYGVRGLKKQIYGGLFFKMIGGYPYKSGMQDYELSLEHHLRFARYGHNLCIFPSGKICKTREKVKARGGVGFLFVQTGLPVVPVNIYGIDNLTLRDCFSRKRKAVVTFGTPLYKEDVASAERSDLYSETAQIILERINSLSSDLQS